MADSDVKGSEMPEGSELQEKSLRDLVIGLIQTVNEIMSDMRWARIERREKYEATLVQQDMTEEVKEEWVAVRQQCEGRTGVIESAVDGRLCPELVDTGAAKTVVREEVVAVQDLPVADWQLCGVTGHCTTPRGPMMATITVGGMEKLPAFVADMEELCLVGLDSLVQSAACVNSGRMQM
ncbi:hypothetical protein E2C01_062611 [Portunus trituberculatus]|uniref:Peptidase A2 domain-containing protein n=1 Tax=Portunus trituberculatus TaxID=210409 RepID=A0A5B7H6V2_PORTR|nr:hypothetical protein [Portunus trituberculatus]